MAFFVHELKCYICTFKFQEFLLHILSKHFIIFSELSKQAALAAAAAAAADAAAAAAAAAASSESESEIKAPRSTRRLCIQTYLVIC